MFTIDESYNIAITRGDTATLEITFDGDAPGETDSVVASVKKSVHRSDEILARTLERQQDGTYLTGAQTISGDAALVAANIKSGVSIFGVAGSLTSATVSQDATTKVLSIS